jgi:hypothetical protein
MFRRHREVTAANQSALEVLFADVETNQKAVVKAGARLAINLFGQDRIAESGRIMAGNYFDAIEIPGWLKFIPFSGRIIAWARSEAQNAADQVTRDNLEWFKHD